MTVEMIEQELEEEKINIALYVYFDNNQFNGYEVVYNIEVEPGVVMTASAKLSLAYTDNAVSGLEFKIFATDALDGTIKLNYANEELVYSADVEVTNQADIDIVLKINDEGLDLDAKVKEILYDGTEELVIVDASINEEGINVSVKYNDVEMIKIAISVSFDDSIPGKELVSINGTFTIKKYTHNDLVIEEPTYELVTETMTVVLQSGNGVEIPASVFELEAEAEDLIELITSSNQPQVNWARDYYFESYTDGEMIINIGDEYNGFIVDSDFAWLYLDGEGTGKFYLTGSGDSGAFNFDPYSFEDYSLTYLHSFDESTSVSMTMQQTYDNKVILTITNVVWDGNNKTEYKQVFTMVPYRIEISEDFEG